MVPRKSTAKEVSFKWSHHRISSANAKVRTTPHVVIIDSKSKRALEALVVYALYNHHFLKAEESRGYCFHNHTPVLDVLY